MLMIGQKGRIDEVRACCSFYLLKKNLSTGTKKVLLYHTLQRYNCQKTNLSKTSGADLGMI